MAQTEKALAKAWAEKEATKKEKVTPSIEVNCPLVESRTEDTVLSLHSYDFLPWGSLEYTPQSPTHEQIVGDQTTEVVHVPFTELRRSNKNKRVNQVVGVLFTATDKEHINTTLGKNKTYSFTANGLMYVSCLTLRNLAYFCFGSNNILF